MESDHLNWTNFAILSVEGSHGSNLTCNETNALISFGLLYSSVHCYVSFIMCPLGIIANLINIVVLNQPSMLSPINLLLTALAVCDATLMALYLPFAIYFLYFNHLHHSSYGWSTYMLFLIVTQGLLHSVSNNIMVTLAAFRVIYVRYLTKCHTLCSMNRTKLAIIISFVIGTVFNIPTYLEHHIVESDQTDDGNITVTMYTVTYKETSLMKVMIWSTAICIKLMPLICLTILSFVIIYTVKKRNAKMRNVKSDASMLMSEQINEELVDGKENNTSRSLRSRKSFKHKGSIGRNELGSSRARAEARMTRLLLTVVFVYVITLLPQAILLFLSDILDGCLITKTYNALGDFTDLLTLVNNCIDFVVYCSMSQQFRDTFMKTFLPWCTKSRKMPAQTERLETPTRSQ